jgi:hypothetical protein
VSFLYPLFLAGIAAISVPIVLHLIRRHTRNRVTFSSLMFLRTTLPRFTSRSRLQNLPLLALRCIILCLLAFAFSRPFFSRPAAEQQVRPGRRIVLLIDTSASMRRVGMWAQAISEAQSALADVSRTDRVCVVSFDQNARTLIGFEQWRSLEPTQRVPVTIEQISELSPNWSGTDLGQALVAAAEAIEDDEINDGQQAIGMRRVVLISDLQRGSRLEALRAYEWPKGMELVVKLIRSQGTTNAALQLVMNRDHLARPGGDDLPGIRITNSDDATAEQFQLTWDDDDSAVASSQITSVYVPAGHSTVVPAPTRADGSAGRKLILTGDDHNFDNALYLAPYLEQQVNILYIGNDDADDPEGMLYYVRRAFGATRALNPHIIPRRADDTIADTDTATAHLIIAADTNKQQHLTPLRGYLESGGTVLLVMKSPDAAAAVAGLAGIEAIEAEEADVDTYTMLSQIEFKHPLLAPFSEPRFGDFTRIHFWKHRQIDIADLPGARVLARFDNNDPALFELPVGKGSLLVLASGWHPSDSQLALSSKFVPLLYSILEYGGVLAGQQSQYFVGDHVPMPHSMTLGSASLRIRKPNNSLTSLDAGRQAFTQADLPGIYAIESSAGNRLFAVNLPVKECQTAAMPIEDLEKLGVSLEQSSSVPAERIKQLAGWMTRPPIVAGREQK